MANIIIGIHGLGNKPTKKLLVRWWKRAMKEGLETNNYSTHIPKFELVYWADILHDKPLRLSEKDEDSPYFLSQKYTRASPGFVSEDHSTRKKVIDFLRNQMKRVFLNKDLSLNYSFISDAIVNKYFSDLEVYYKEDCTIENESVCKAKDLIKNRLTETLLKYKNDNIMLISHSMGSIIAFDVLSFETNQIPVNTFITAGSPLGLPVIINKIATSQESKSVVDNPMITPPSIYNNWFNYADIMDKIATNYKLADDFAENSHGVIPADFLVVNNYESGGKRNPHKSYGYLRTPEFSKVLFDFIQSGKLTLKQKAISHIYQIYSTIKRKFNFQNKSSYET